MSVQVAKAVAHHWRLYGLDQSPQLNAWGNFRVNNSEDVKEGPRAFAEKRPPVWKGRRPRSILSSPRPSLVDSVLG